MNAINKAIDSIIAAAPPIEPEDYIGPDGLLYCGKCHTPRQYRLNNLGDMRVVPVLCKCQMAAEEAERQEAERRRFEKRVDRLRRNGLPEPESRYSNFDADDQSNPKVSTAVKKYADEFDAFSKINMGLLLYGPVGTGKTFYAACIANALIDRGIPVLMTNFTRIINTMQGLFEGRQDYIDSLNDYKLLIIDDLGVERESEYMQEQVYNIINARYESRKPLIVTTNISMDEIKNPKDAQRHRIYDRVLEICFPVKVDGESRRRENVKKTYDERRKLLGL